MHKETINLIAFNHDKNLLTSVSDDHTIIL